MPNTMGADSFENSTIPPPMQSERSHMMRARIMENAVADAAMRRMDILQNGAIGENPLQLKFHPSPSFSTESLGWESNPQPTAYKAVALTVELHEAYRY